MCILANSIDITARQEDVNVVLYEDCGDDGMGIWSGSRVSS